MGNAVTIIATAAGAEKKVTFEISKKDGKVFVKVHHEEEHVGDLEVKMDDFNNFCLDLFNEHKKIFAE